MSTTKVLGPSPRFSQEKKRAIEIRYAKLIPMIAFLEEIDTGKKTSSWGKNTEGLEILLTKDHFVHIEERFLGPIHEPIESKTKGVIPMDCTTVKPGVECAFMTKNGCSFNGGTCHPIVEQCEGCNRASECVSGWYCTACPDPSLKWKNGKCNLATHVKTSATENGAKINPLKASKRNAH